MPSCAVCTHDQRKAIEADLASGKAQRDVARRYRLRKDSVHRHAANHLAGKAEKVEAGRRASILERIEAHLAMASQLVRDAGDPRILAAMMAEVRKSLELIGRISGEVPTGSQVTVNFFQKLGVESEAHLRELLAFGRATKERGDVDEHEAAHAAAEWLARYFIANPDKRFDLLATLGAGESGAILSPAHGAESHQPALNGDAR